MGTYSDPALILPGAVGQTELDAASKKDVVGGVAALDASGFVLAKGAGVAFPRNGSDDVHIYERTAGEEAYAFHRVGADDYTFYIKESNVWKRFLTESMNVCRISSGNYTGNDTVNRAIAHGLAGTPKLVSLVRVGTGHYHCIMDPGEITYLDPVTEAGYAVTAADSTNFYVGNSAAYNPSCNGSGITYRWVAFL